MTIVVIGRSGQLAQALAAQSAPVRCIGREDWNADDPASVHATLERLAPDAVINAAAYTQVDKAESESDAADALNARLPGQLAALCATLNVPLVHVSTDYVFDGTKPAPYVETDPIAPQSAYGRSKAAGESAVLGAGGRAAVLRTSWVYAATGANFVRTMLRLASSREEIGVVADQCGRPTWAADLAQAVLAAAQGLQRGAPGGLYHFADAGDATWADFAEAIFAEAAAVGLPHARVKRITTAEYPTPAQRPANSRLDTSKFEATFGLAPRSWREALRLCLREIAQANTA